MPASVSDSLSVCSRPDPALFVTLSVMLAACTGAFAILVYNAPHPPKGIAEALFVMGFLGALFAFAAFMAVFPLLRWVSASEDGLRAPNRFIPWSDIADFYEVAPPANHSSARAATLVLQTKDGRRLRVLPSWTNREALREIVARRATAARVREWGMKGARPEDEWPRVFDYQTPTNRAGIPLVTTVLIGVLFVLVLLLARGALRNAHELGWLWGLGFFFVGFLVMGSKVALLLYVTISLQKELRRRREQRLMISAHGLVFSDSHRRIAATWDEITDYEIGEGDGHCSVYRVITRNGTFDFTPAIRDSQVVRAVIARNAPVGDGKWQGRLSDALITLKTLPGVTAHHYRTFLNRTLLLLPSAIVLILPLPHLLRWSMDPSATLPTEFPFVFTGVALATAWLWACYFRCRIE